MLRKFCPCVLALFMMGDDHLCVRMVTMVQLRVWQTAFLIPHGSIGQYDAAYTLLAGLGSSGLDVMALCIVCVCVCVCLNFFQCSEQC